MLLIYYYDAKNVKMGDIMRVYLAEINPEVMKITYIRCYFHDAK